MEDKILSIVIPVYNVEKYLEKCLLSCINQDISYEKYEIIVVIDGSPDNSLAIAENISHNYCNIRIISQENKGLSGARNTGMKNAKGEYIWFVDSDDYIEKNCLGHIITYLKNDLDILQIQYRYVYEDGRTPQDAKLYQIDGIRTGLEIIKQRGLPIPAQFSIYRSKFLQKYNLSFVEGIYHEDCEFKPRVTYFAKKIRSDVMVCYNYLQREFGSITSSFKLKNGMDLLSVNNLLLEFVEKQNIPFIYRIYFYNQISQNINSLLLGLRFLVKDDKNQMLIHLKYNKHLFLVMARSNMLKYRLEGIIFYLSIKLGLLLHHKIR